VNPVGVFGPVLGKDNSTSSLIVQRLIDGELALTRTLASFARGLRALASFASNVNTKCALSVPRSAFFCCVLRRLDATGDRLVRLRLD
jgi:hypothetical protein